MIYTIVFFSIFAFSAQGMAIEAFMILTSPDKIIYKIDEKDAPYKEIITKGLRIGPWLFHDYFFDSFENYLSGGEEFFDVGNGSWHRAIRLPASCLQRSIKEGKLPKLKQQLRAKKVSTLLELYHFEKDPRYKELFALIRFEDKVPSLKYLAAYAVHVDKKHPSIKNFKQVLPAELLDQIELYASDNASYELLNCKWGLVFSREDYC